jgi:ketol-acid reductoisomerase
MESKKIYRDSDVDLSILDDKVVAVLGYGIQGQPQALNFRDSGLNVIVGAGPRDLYADWDKAEADGFDVFDIGEATRRADIIHILLADPAQPEVYREAIQPNLKPGVTLSFCHGFNVLYGSIKPPKDVNVTLYVPNAPGHKVRDKFLEGSGIYGAVSVEQDVTGDASEIVLAIAKAAGSTRVGVVALSFQHETEGDNFEEQVLYGGTIHLMKAVFDTMVDNGYPPYFAYAKAVRSLRTVIDVMDEIGIEAYISERSSRTCEFAVRTSGPRVVNYDEVKKIFQETERGEFAARWMEEWRLGMPRLHRLRRTGADSTMETVGREWRELFAEG